ncbi:DUF2953 domain-containing protein [Clostridium sp. DJ247]|uniref:DUF2953 domain-containing protein n=1 Tax=Clostridium sp. DJ247 TaxID=2726188 RepID=UPI001625F1AE|nr:DUF2953 domain-containing protein [Clostridium sp. DJ247]MBC2580498.1 DUF2953 domain-containing protein [Clostridium sp. DJ247]
MLHSNLNDIKNKKHINHKHKPYYTFKKYFDKKFLCYTISYLKSILSIIKPYYIKIDGTYGLEDPSTTGMLCAFISILSQITPSTEINLNPNFDEEVLNIKLIVYGKIFLLLLLIKTLRFLLSKEIRKKVFKKSKTAETY